MESTGTGSATEGNEDALKAWLDGCYRMWKKAYQLLLWVVITVVWLPLLIFVYHSLLPRFSHSLFWNFDIIGLNISVILATMIPTAAAAVFRYPAEIILTTSHHQAYRSLRQSVRRTALRWLVGLYLLPFIGYRLISLKDYTIHSVSTTEPIGSDLLDYVIIHVLIPVLQYTILTWFVLELIQYIALRQSHLLVIWKIAAVFFITWCVALISAYVHFNGLFDSFPLVTTSRYGYDLPNLLYTIPAIYMMLATRRPTKAMLERL